MSAVCCTIPNALPMTTFGFGGRSLDNSLMRTGQYEASVYCNVGNVPVADLPECNMRNVGAHMQMAPVKDCWQSTNGGCVTTHADCSISGVGAYHSTRKAESSSQSWLLQHQPTAAAGNSTIGANAIATSKFVMPSATPRSGRRAAGSAASAGRGSQRMVPNLHASTAPVRRALCVDPNKDYSMALHVDCSIEYDLPRVARPPPGAQPLLLIAKPSRPSLTPSATYHSPRQPLRHDVMLRPVTNLYDNTASAKGSTPRQHEMTPPWWSYGSINNSSDLPAAPSQALYKLSTMDYLPLATCSSVDSGRGTDSERSPGTGYPLKQQMPWTQIPAPVDSGLGMDPCVSARQLRSFESIQQNAFDNFRTEVKDVGQQCHCCHRAQQEGVTRVAAVAPVTMSAAFRWAPYSTQLRQMCPPSAAVALQQLQQHRNARSKQIYAQHHHLQQQQQLQQQSRPVAFHI